ncbi:hypothetical protein ACE6H2_012221 [Prunus campanulata]
MGEVAAAGLFSVWHCQPLFCPRRGMRAGAENLKGKLMKKQDRLCHVKALFNPSPPKKKEPLTFYFRHTIDAPLYESPRASFYQYLEDEKRVFKAIFQDEEKTQLNAEEWRIQMPAMQVLFLSIYLILYVKLRMKSMGKDYPSHVPQDISKVLEIDITRWELLGPSDYEPRDFSLSIKGTIYSERQGAQSWLRNIFDINISVIVSPLLAWVPDDVMRNITKTLVKTTMDDVKINARLLADYDKFKTEKLKNVV